MKRLLIKLAMTTAVVVPLSACGNSNDMDDVVVVPPPTATPAPPPPFTIGTAPLESLGTGFAALFRTDSNTEPRDPTEGDLAAISFTTEPAEITGI